MGRLRGQTGWGRELPSETMVKQGLSHGKTGVKLVEPWLKLVELWVKLVKPWLKRVKLWVKLLSLAWFHGVSTSR